MDGSSAERRPGPAALRAAAALLPIPAHRLWVSYVTMGGTLSCPEMVAALAGRVPLVRREYDRLAAAINDELLDHGVHHHLR